MEYVDYVPHWEEWISQREDAASICQMSRTSHRPTDFQNEHDTKALSVGSQREYRACEKIKKITQLNNLPKRELLTWDEKVKKKRSSAVLRQQKYRKLKKLRLEQEQILASEIIFKLQEEEKLRKIDYSSCPTIKTDKKNEYIQNIYTKNGQTTFAFEGEQHIEIENEFFIKPCIIIKDKYRNL